MVLSRFLKPSSPGGNTFAPMAPTSNPPSSPGGNTFAPMAPVSNPPSTPGGNTFATPMRPSSPGGNTFAPMAPAPRIAPVSAPRAAAPYVAPSQPAPYAAPEPPPPPAPPVGGRKWYEGLGAPGQAAENQKWLGGDSDYTAQIAEYDRALEAFIDRIAKQNVLHNQDADDALASTGRNQDMSLTNLGEDFGARGLAYSGLFDKTKNETNERFNEAKGGIEKVRTRNLTDTANRRADYESESRISKQDAERSSLARQAQRQALLDSMAGF